MALCKSYLVRRKSSIAALSLPLFLLASSAAAQGEAPNPLLAARQAYNAGRFDDAIAAAEAARAQPALANAAAVVLARARLEKYRTQGGDQPDLDARADLDAAREVLKLVDESRLDARDRIEYLVALGEALYLDDPPQFGAAAEFFELALDRAGPLTPAARDIVFEWWAGALDRLAQFGAEADRRVVYERVLAGAVRYRALDDTSAVSWYWIAVAARGVQDLERAWASAVAAWIRSADLGARGPSLRQDLDRFVTDVILPERATRLAPGDPRSALPLLQAQWDEIKKKWARRP